MKKKQDTATTKKARGMSLRQLSTRLKTLERQATQQSVQIDVALEAHASPARAVTLASESATQVVTEVDAAISPRTPRTSRHVRGRPSQPLPGGEDNDKDKANDTVAPGGGGAPRRATGAGQLSTQLSTGRLSPLHVPRSVGSASIAARVGSVESLPRALAESCSTVDASFEAAVAPMPMPMPRPRPTPAAARTVTLGSSASADATDGPLGEKQQQQLLAASEASLAALRQTLAAAQTLAAHVEAARAALQSGRPKTGMHLSTALDD